MNSTTRLALSPVPSLSLGDAFITRGRKDSSAAMAAQNTQITMFKITTSAGNAIDQPVRPGDRFSGVLVVQLTRPISATQVILELKAGERWTTSLKGSMRPERTPIFSAELVLWRAVRNGAANASTVLSDGLHVFNFSCQIPNLNYPQNVQRPEYDISYQLEARLFAPGDMGGERIVGMITKDLFFTPLVVLMPSTDPLATVETLCFEKKGRLGKPVVELRVATSTRQLMPGAKVKIDMQIKELTSTSWTRVMVKLIERTQCRISAQLPFSQPLWSVDRELAQTEVVRSSVYSYFINDDMMASHKTSTETKTAAGETVTTDSVVFAIPPVAYGAMNTEHLEFTHFVRMEVVLPGLMSSNRSVTMDLPVQMMTCEMHTAARFMSRRGSIPNIERKLDSDASSMVSGKSSSSGGHRSTQTARQIVLSADTQACIMNSLPPRYCDIPPEQRPAPVLAFVKQMNVSQQPNPDDQARSLRNHTMTSMHSFDARTSSSGNSADEQKERYRSRPLPMAPAAAAGGLPPPLPAEPMPSGIPISQRPASSRTQASMPRTINQTNIDVYQHSMRNPLVLAPYSPDDSASAVGVMRSESPVGGSSSMTPEDPYVLASTKLRQHHPASRLQTPVSPLYNGTIDEGLSDDDEAGYFREPARQSFERDPLSDPVYRIARNNAAIKHYH
ncbi:hypothetical protein LPJ61_000209 [Coemansia biformis]|uniref:Arrestin C-terminal-like domain-containing protein n=1 Tax=Coemansia biformis TaxID=1286918 RepID=A0A9W7YH62_9FUNG|nr:hypothetical protein LPJ61_000209 [Coemansia biformis]